MSDAPRPMPEILAELQAAADEVTAQRLHFGYIADTIRVNALRNGATTEQVEDFIHGRASFVNWIAELVEARGKTENAALQSRVAELEAANRGLVRLNEATEARAEAAEAALARALPTTAAERDVLTERSRQVVVEGWDALIEQFRGFNMRHSASLAVMYHAVMYHAATGKNILDITYDANGNEKFIVSGKTNIPRLDRK